MVHIPRDNAMRIGECCAKRWAYAGRPYDMVRISRDVGWTYLGGRAHTNRNAQTYSGNVSRAFCEKWQNFHFSLFFSRYYSSNMIGT